MCKNSVNTCLPYFRNRLYMHIVNLSSESKELKTAARKQRCFEFSQLENMHQEFSRYGPGNSAPHRNLLCLRVLQKTKTKYHFSQI